MPAGSKAQRRFMAMVEHDPTASPEVAKAAESMTKSQARDFAKTPEKGLPEHVKPKHKKKHGAGGPGMVGAGRQPKPRGGSFY